MSANDKQIGGRHYQKEVGKPQHWDWAADMPYLEARCTAYIERHTRKNGLMDMEKALHFMEKILEVRYGAALNWEIIPPGTDEELTGTLGQNLQNPYANAPGAVQGFARNPEDKWGDLNPD